MNKRRPCEIYSRLKRLIQGWLNTIEIDRDSVCMADDMYSHSSPCYFSQGMLLSQWLRKICSEGYLPKMENAVWVVCGDNLTIAYLIFDKIAKFTIRLSISDIEMKCLEVKKIFFYYSYYGSMKFPECMNMIEKANKETSDVIHKIIQLSSNRYDNNIKKDSINYSIIELLFLLFNKDCHVSKKVVAINFCIEKSESGYSICVYGTKKYDEKNVYWVNSIDYSIYQICNIESDRDKEKFKEDVVETLKEMLLIMSYGVIPKEYGDNEYFKGKIITVGFKDGPMTRIQ